MIIELSKQGKNKGKYFALVDDKDFKWLNQFRWAITNNGYAVRRVGNRLFQMHRQIIGTPSEFDTDHINGNKLDNRRCNLRVVTRSQNNANQKINSANTSGYKGVSWNKHLKYWSAYIKYNGKRIVKYFKTKDEAAKGYNKLAMIYFGKFAKLNDIL